MDSRPYRFSTENMFLKPHVEESWMFLGLHTPWCFGVKVDIPLPTTDFPGIYLMSGYRQKREEFSDSIILRPVSMITSANVGVIGPWTKRKAFRASYHKYEASIMARSNPCWPKKEWYTDRFHTTVCSFGVGYSHIPSLTTSGNRCLGPKSIAPVVLSFKSFEGDPLGF